MVVVSREQHVGDRCARRRRREDGHQRAGPVLLHLHRRVEHVERAGREQPIHQRPEQLRVHVVDLALDRDDPLGRRRPRRRSPRTMRSTFGASFGIAVAGTVADARPGASPAAGRTPRA